MGVFFVLGKRMKVREGSNLDRVEPAERREGDEQEDGPRSPLGERIALLGRILTGNIWRNGF